MGSINLHFCRLPSCPKLSAVLIKVQLLSGCETAPTTIAKNLANQENEKKRMKKQSRALIYFDNRNNADIFVVFFLFVETRSCRCEHA